MARRKMPGLRADARGSLAQVLAALESTLRLRVDAEERTRIRRCEELRRRLRSSERVIGRRFFGLPSNSPGDPQPTTASGVVVEESIGRICRRASRQYFWCLLLFRLVRELEPDICLELGTSLGISASYQASALELNQRGRLITLEGEPTLARISAENLAGLSLSRARVVAGMFEETLPWVLDENHPIDLCFVDAGKRRDDMLRTLQAVQPFLASDAVVVIDDIHWSSDLTDSWHRVRREPTVRASIDLEAVGVLLFDPSLAGPNRIDLPIG